MGAFAPTEEHSYATEGATAARVIRAGGPRRSSPRPPIRPPSHTKGDLERHQFGEVLRCLSLLSNSQLMSNVATVLKDEFSRVARKEIRRETSVSKEVFNNPPLRDRGVEAPSARARAPAAASGQGRGVVSTGCSERRLCLARHSLQRQEHGFTTAPSRLVSSRMRPSHRRLGAVDLQLGRGQGAPARPAPASDLRAQELGTSASERDPGDAQGSVGLRCKRQVGVEDWEVHATLSRVGH